MKQGMGMPCWTPVLTVLRHDAWTETGKPDRSFNGLNQEKRKCSVLGCVLIWGLQTCLDTSSYLTVLHSLAEEVVQQQVLQLGVSVERLFDFTQKDAVTEKGVCYELAHYQ